VHGILNGGNDVHGESYFFLQPGKGSLLPGESVNSADGRAKKKLEKSPLTKEKKSKWAAKGKMIMCKI